MKTFRSTALAVLAPLFCACASGEDSVDLLLLGGSVLDGSGSGTVIADVAVAGDQIWRAGWRSDHSSIAPTALLRKASPAHQISSVRVMLGAPGPSLPPSDLRDPPGRILCKS